MMPKAVFWDMDGTLVDSEPLHDAALASALHSVGLTPPADLHERVLGQAAGPVYEMMRREFGLTLDFDDWIHRKYTHYLSQAINLKPRPGALEIFRELKQAGTVQAIVSNSDRLVVDANLRAVGFMEYGLKSVSRNDVRVGKPDPECYLRAASRAARWLESSTRPSAWTLSLTCSGRLTPIRVAATPGRPTTHARATRAGVSPASAATRTSVSTMSQLRSVKSVSPNGLAPSRRLSSTSLWSPTVAASLGSPPARGAAASTVARSYLPVSRP